MALEMRQTLGMVQQLVMTPQLQQAIKLLQLSHQELVDEIQQQIVENPTLEVEGEGDSDSDSVEGSDSVEDPAGDVEGAGFDAASAQAPILERGDLPEPFAGGERVVSSAEREPAPAEKDPISEIDWSKYMDSIRDQTSGGAQRVRSEELPSLESSLTRQGNLCDHLEWQLRLSDLGSGDVRIGLAILYNLDEYGYLKGIELEDLAQEMEVGLEDLERVLQRIQAFDPLGVGARDLSECLLIQSRVHFPGDEAMEEVLSRHLQLLEKKNYSQIARELKIPVEEVYQIHRQITELDPRPGRAYSGDEPRYITPDIHIVKIGDRFHAVLNEDGLPKLRVSDYYRRALLENSNRQTKDYIQDKLRSAAWLIRSIHQRQRTIVRVTESIIKFQREFLERGVHYMVPLILKEVADDIGMHESTVSRVTSNKYVHTPQGLFELKFFFNSGINRYMGSDIASESVKNKIKKIVQEERPEKPHSDQKIVRLLAQQNINIARRTVAKYREMLGILSSSKRKRMF